MANPLDYLKDLIPEDTNIFGASPSAGTQQLTAMGLLSPEDVEKAKKQSLLQGLLSTGLAYAAQPKNQGYGSIFPYLAKAGLQGVQAAQTPFDTLSKDAMTRAQLEEMQRKRDLIAKEKTFREAMTMPNAQQIIDPNQKVSVAPFRTGTMQDYTVGSGVMGAAPYEQQPTAIAPDFTTSQVTAPQASQLGVSTDQLNVVERVADPELNNIYKRYKEGLDGYDTFISNRKDYINSKKKIYTEEDPTKRIVEVDPVSGERTVIQEGVAKPTTVAPSELEKLLAAQEVAVANGDTRQGVIIQKRIDKLTAPTKPLIEAGETAFSKKAGDTRFEQFNNEVLDVDKGLAAFNKTNRALKLIIEGTPILGQLSKVKLMITKLKNEVLGTNPTQEDIDKISDSELLSSTLGSDVFPLIGELGIGARGIDTPAERDFLQDVFTGRLTMNKETLSKLTALRNKKAMGTIHTYNKGIKNKRYKEYEDEMKTTLEEKPVNFKPPVIIDDAMNLQYKYDSGKLEDDNGNIIDVNFYGSDKNPTIIDTQGNIWEQDGDDLNMVGAY